MSLLELPGDGLSRFPALGEFPDDGVSLFPILGEFPDDGVSRFPARGEFPDDGVSLFPARGDSLLLPIVLDFSEGVLFLIFGGFPLARSNPIGLKISQVGHIHG